MKKLLLTILFTLVLCGGASAQKYPAGYILYKDSEKIHIIRTGLDMSKIDLIAINHCGKDRYTYHVGGGAYIGKGELLKMYERKGHKFPILLYPTIAEYICSDKNYTSNPPNSYRPGKELAQKWPPNKNLNYSSNTNNSSSNNSKQNVSFEFNIAQKKEQCEAIGFKPETEKFADCVLRLVELDVKQQTQNQIVSAQNSGNDALAKQLERQNNLQSSQALIDLGQQLMKPKQYNSNIYMPQTRRCTVSGFGVTSVVRCY